MTVLNWLDGLQSVTLKLNKGNEDVFSPEDKIYRNKVAVNPKKDLGHIKSQTIYLTRISRILWRKLGPANFGQSIKW